MSDKCELKPCPFCGGAAILERRTKGRRPAIVVRIARCRKCDAKMGEYITDEAAASAWNRRWKEGGSRGPRSWEECAKKAKETWDDVY